MDESYFKDRISAYFDKDLPPDEYEAVDNWLKNSPEGRKALEELGRFDEFVKQQLEIRGGDEFFERQAKSIEQKLGFQTAEPHEEKVVDIRPQSRWRTALPKIAAVAASIAVLVFIGLNYESIFQGDEVFQDQMQPSDAAPRRQEMPGISVDTGAQQQETETAAERDAAEDVVAGDKTEIIPPERLREPAPDVAKPEKRSGVPLNDRIEAPPKLPPSAEPSSPDLIEPLTKEQIDMAGKQVLPAPVDEEKIDIAEPAIPQLAEEYEPIEDVRRALTAGTGTEGGVGTDSAITTLGEWRALRDDMITALDWRLQTEDKSPQLYSNQIQPQQRSAIKSKRPKGGLAAAAKKKEQEAKLLEACYHIVELTPDKDERQRALKIIQTVAVDTTSSNLDLARQYLDSLENE